MEQRSLLWLYRFYMLKKLYPVLLRSMRRQHPYGSTIKCTQRYTATRPSVAPCFCGTHTHIHTYHYKTNSIPLCLNPKFQNLYRLAAHDTQTTKKLLNLQLGAISISDIEMVKRRLLDSQPFFDGSRLEIFPGQKWSISKSQNVEI